jgi:hypothetical protein
MGVESSASSSSSFRVLLIVVQMCQEIKDSQALAREDLLCKV